MNNKLLFAMYYSNLVAMLMHPGHKAGISDDDLEQCSLIALRMLKITEDSVQCQSLHQH
jgi:hypothetical protein